jgi:ubiquinol-cytochrome c reductase cytochrome b subunit/menaquinol-cytochrome c reductase cytochrome b/c subunit
VNAAQRFYWLPAALLAVAVAGCGGAQKTSPPPSPNGLAIGLSADLHGPARARAVAGRNLVGQAGCLACHMIGSQGNNGPGPNLTHVGRQLSPTALLHVLRSPRPPMPSFASLRATRLADVVAFLHTLH